MNILDYENFKIIKNKKALLCVSGGVDSMVLLDAIFKSKNDYHIDLAVCHFEHGIRGEESLLDMDFVVKTCNRLNVPVFVGKEDILKISGGVNVEEIGRERRYAFFYKVLKEQHGDYLVLAHHKDDNCETVIMNMIRGCGMLGLCGMEKVSGRIVRPLLDYTKKELMEYAEKNGVEYHEDSTNTDCSYLRNSIRNEIMPLLLKKNPAIVNSIDKMRKIITEENSFLDEYIKTLPWIIKRDYGYDIKVDELNSAHKAIKYRSVYWAIKSIIHKDFDFSAAQDVLHLVDKDTGKKICLKDLTVYRQPGVLSFVKNTVLKPFNTPLEPLGVTKTSIGNFTVEGANDLSKLELENAPKGVAHFTLPKDCKLYVRQRRDGDVIIGFDGHSRKLKDLFINAKIPVFLRDRIPIIWDGLDIVYVPGVLRSNKYPFNKKGISIEYNRKD